MRQQARSSAVIWASGAKHAIIGAAQESSNSKIVPKWRRGFISFEDTPYRPVEQLRGSGAAIPQPSGELPSRRNGSLEMPAFWLEGEIRGYVLRPNRGRNQEMERSTAQMPERRLGLEREGSSKTSS